MKRFITSSPFLYTAGLILVFALWFVFSYAQGFGSLVFPSPAATFAALGDIMSRPYIYEALGNSLLHAIEGFAVAFALALLFGSLAGEFPFLKKVFQPLMTVLKSAPTAVFVFLFVLLSTSRNAPIWVVGLLAFPILYEAVRAGVDSVDRELVGSASVDGANSWQILTRIKIPLSLPYVALGVVASFALSFKTSIMAEVITGSTAPGLGAAILLYRDENPVDLSKVFAVAVIAIAVVLLFDAATAVLKYGLKRGGLIERD